ncbi:hypothetical protein VOLCADRAFT_90568 [Volvox carteri f. nagariensis]|uniref:Uncharacterized protein n=1 Tax=Volvox carteri f. nagariensis TaxID=3068 RepID=D8TUR5_VOLCA|nr:uncharacterized protein VOLCADRAFT_90568 [Volvox carteri f. nagariensis]EFJ48870.1 hypothetical protein VOLCADRAFT_90568 [Volvox carteri f. nagariensis]|eukprot:XP_002950202.1 hypothetical protein VOLCADRAFT_90568 [Volvox carteri f. nagariensis]
MATSSRRAAACWDLPVLLALLMLLAALLLLLTPAPAFGGRTYDKVAGGVGGVIAIEDGSGLREEAAAVAASTAGAVANGDVASGLGYTATGKVLPTMTQRKLNQVKVTSNVKVETSRVKYTRKTTKEIGGGGK